MMMSSVDVAVLKALGEEGGDCEGQALVNLQDNCERTTMRTQGDSRFREVQPRPLTGAYDFQLAKGVGQLETIGSGERSWLNHAI